MTAISDIVVDTAGGIYVFPTAVENTFTVSAHAAIAALQAMAINGATVLSLSGNGDRELTVDFSAVAPGIYLVRTTLADGTDKVIKIIKK